jgi:predicted restriction endonuclease
MGGGRTYSEAHHIRPLGAPHLGRDTRDNIIVLCPNHHAQCDFLAVTIDLASLRLHPDHAINQKHIEYHNDRVIAPQGTRGS